MAELILSEKCGFKGEEIMFTQGSVDFMDLVGRAISSSGSTSQ